MKLLVTGETFPQVPAALRGPDSANIVRYFHLFCQVNSCSQAENVDDKERDEIVSGIEMDMIDFIIGAGVLVAVVLLWFLLSYWLSPHVDSPSGEANLTGSCGDTMEIALKFDNNQVAEASYWTNGCAYSFNCIFAAAELAKGKTPDEILEIDPETIRGSVGGLPEGQMHCARLSVETLHAALDDFMRKRASPAP